MLSSECPGWVCYLEKVLGDKLVPFASTIKPPQLVAAHILKNIIRDSTGLTNSEIFIGLIAPCFDKKLEAVRETSKMETTIIDLVLATNEIIPFIKEHISDIPNFISENINNDSEHFVEFSKLLKSFNINSNQHNFDNFDKFKTNFSDFKIKKSFLDHGSSNGYVEWMIKKYKNVKNVSFKQLKSKNFTEIKVEFENPDKPDVLFALVYGFKNIQNLVRKIKVY